MYGSGAVTGMAAIAAVYRQTLRVLPLALTVCIVAVTGTPMLRAVAVLIAATPPRPTGATSSASVWPYSEFFPKGKKQESKVVFSQTSAVACGAATSRGRTEYN